MPPAPPADAVYTTPGPYVDPTYAEHRRHLAADVSLGAAREFEVMLPVLPEQRMLPALAVAGLNRTASHTRGIALPTLLMYGGTDGVRVLDDMWTFTVRTVLENFDSEGTSWRGAFVRACVRAQVSAFLPGAAVRRLELGWPVPPADGDDADSFEQYRRSQCAYRLVLQGAAQTAWSASCEGPGTAQCSPLDVLVRAWCVGEWQVRRAAIAIVPQQCAHACVRATAADDRSRVN